jgi:hypothetical protein
MEQPQEKEETHPAIALLLADIINKEATTFDEVSLLLQAKYILREIQLKMKTNYPLIHLDGIPIRKEIAQQLLCHGFSFWHHKEKRQEYLFLPGVSAEKWFRLNRPESEIHQYQVLSL